MSLLRTTGLHHSYRVGTPNAVDALRGITITIGPGEYVALLGANGSGKSTLLRHFNALLLPTAGEVYVREWDTRDRSRLREIRSTVSMVFQVPDSQIVATVVEEDVAFGPENLGVPRDMLVRRVEWALERTGIAHLRQRASHLLSAGQKQRLAIASALAMQPSCLLLDEATAMLDPMGRLQLLDLIDELHRDGLTIVSATHYMAEAVRAHRVLVLSDGQVVFDGTPQEVFADPGRLAAWQLDLPPAAQLARDLAAHLPGWHSDALTVPELVHDLQLHLDRPLWRQA